jgi:hypothetical protein
MTAITEFLGRSAALSSTTPLVIGERYAVSAPATMTRPANATPYSIGDAVSNNATAASVSAIALTAVNGVGAAIAVTRVRLLSTDTGPGTAAAQFRAWLFTSDPAANAGIGGGDNAAWSQKQAGFVGSLLGTFRAFADGSAALCVPDEGPYIVTTPVPGGQLLYVLLQTLSAWTPSANATTFTAISEGIQGVA